MTLEDLELKDKIYKAVYIAGHSVLTAIGELEEIQSIILAYQKTEKEVKSGSKPFHDIISVLQVVEEEIRVIANPTK